MKGSNTEGKKRRTPLRWRCTADIAWFFSGCLGVGFVFPAQIDISVGLRAAVYSSSHLGPCSYHRNLSFHVRSCCSQSWTASCGFGIDRSLPACKAPLILSQHLVLHRSSGFYGFTFFARAAGGDIHFLQLHRELRGKVAGGKVWWGI